VERSAEDRLDGLGARNSRADRVVWSVFAACALVTVLTTAGILLVLLGESLAFFCAVGPARFLLDTQWTPLFADQHFGIWPLVAGTIVTTLIAVAVALPLGLAGAIYLGEFAPEHTRRVAKPSLELLAAVPTVVYGYFALTLVTPVLQNLIPDLAGFNALAPGLVMCLMILPVIA
jgi:phosphate transport system permease protein